MASVRAAEQILNGQATIKEWQEELYKDIHSHPELGFQEERTAAIAAEHLRSFGFEVHEKVGPTGVVGVLSNGEGPVVLMRADLDALPVKEATGLDYASTQTATDDQGNVTAVMHACGHDVHVSSLLGAARLLSETKDAWRGTYIALFQPAEELATGAQSMVDDRLADLIPQPTVALSQHVLAKPAGTVSTHAGPFLSMGASLRVTLFGRGSHGSMPHLSIDPVVLAAMVVVRLQTVVAREVEPGEFAVLTVGKLTAGAKSNIIDDHAVLELNIRAYDRSVRDHLMEAVRRIAASESEASGSTRAPEIEVINSYPLTDNDPDVTKTVARAFGDYFPSEALVSYGRQTASEDFSAIPDALGVPYTYWGVGGTDPAVCSEAQQRGTVAQDIPGNHSPMFAPVLQPTLTDATAAAVVAACAWLGRDS